MEGSFTSYMMTSSKAILIILAFLILLRCVRSMLREKFDPETWAYIRSGREKLPVNHWEVVIGRSRNADVRINRPNLSPVHAVLRRFDNGEWRIFDVFGNKDVWINGAEVARNGTRIIDGDVLNFSGLTSRFQDLSQEKREKLETSRAGVGRRYSPAFTLLMLTVMSFVI